MNVAVQTKQNTMFEDAKKAIMTDLKAISTLIEDCLQSYTDTALDVVYDNFSMLWEDEMDFHTTALRKALLGAVEVEKVKVLGLVEVSQAARVPPSTAHGDEEEGDEGDEGEGEGNGEDGMEA
jgi:hypothetical protein